jgi:hypothetical protein
MKTFIVELWANQDLGRIDEISVPEDLVIDPDNKNTLCILSRYLIKHTNGLRTPESTYQNRPLLMGDVFRVGSRRFCILSPKKSIDYKIPQESEVQDYFVLELSKA